LLRAGGDACALLDLRGWTDVHVTLAIAATVPHAIVPVLVVLLLASILQIVSEALLQYSGFFRSLAYNGAASPPRWSWQR